MTCSLEKIVQPPQVVALNLPENSACTLLRKRTIEIRPIPIPVLAPDGVLVKVMATGICGSDLHNFTAGGVGGRPVLEPLVMGHESVGEVIAIGDEVTTHKVGDRVAVEPGSPCRKCRNCKEGRMNICLYGKYCGAPGSVGSLTRFAALPADMAPHLPEGIEWDVAGALQPLAIGVQIGKRCDIRAHQTVAVMGCGPIGLIAAAVAHAYCVSGIIGFDNNPKRVEFARKYLSPITGKPIFDKIFLVEELVGIEGGFTPGDAKFEAAKLRAARYLEEAGWSADGVDRVIEASGAEDAAMLGIALAKMGATYIAVGLGHHQTSAFPVIAVTNKDIAMMGITRYTASCFPDAIDLLRRGMVDLKPLITKTFSLSQSQEAFECVASAEEIKVVIRNQDV